MPQTKKTVSDDKAPKKLRLWVHGSSAGDVLAQQPLIEELRRRYQVDLTLTAFTGSGVEMAQKCCQPARVAFQPLDLPGATARAVKHIDAEWLILERAEIWPALIYAAHRHGTRVAIVNGRISPGSVKAYQRLFALAGPVLDNVDLFLMRDDDEAKRICQIGAADKRVYVTGNTKLDKAQKKPDDEQIAKMAALLNVQEGDPLWVAGSTHRGEEALLFGVFAELLKHEPAARLLIAPRYVERADAVEKLARQAGDFSIARRQRDRPQEIGAAQIVILDSMGELAATYALARLAFVGGTLIPRGGQNMLEPAMLGVPVVVGPYTDDARDQLALLRGQGLFEIRGQKELQSQVAELMNNPNLAQAQGKLAAQAVLAGLGAARRCADMLQDAHESRPDTSSDMADRL
jgi:3-deoxy-D-manno-octulosonic-acid transferase